MSHNILLIAEKPSVALRIAIALSNGSPKRLGSGKVGYYYVERPEANIYVVAAVGHLFTISQNGGSHDYPVLDVKWEPSYKVNQSSYFTKGYLDVIRDVGRKCDIFINACDYDLEGTVIGTNIIKDVTGGAPVRASSASRRMKFSTTTTPDLLNAYSDVGEIDIDNFYAGEARHIIDWLWGINLSRALTSALRKYEKGKALSIGRVQGPTLSVLAEREAEIEHFKPEPYWKLYANVNSTRFVNERGEIFDKKEAESALNESEQNKEAALIKSVGREETKRYPYPAFDLTSLQLEASRILKMDPSVTLSVAQSLYERSYISYPRTASQKLPPTLGLQRIIEEIGKNGIYKKYSEAIIARKAFRPIQGKKTDEAHPAIFPTGIEPKSLSKDESALYDLVTRRFLACFGEPADMVKFVVKADIGKERYSASGTTILKRGWMDVYHFVKGEEKNGSIEAFVEGERRRIDGSVELDEQETKPKRRFTKASLIAELERINLGTKATRASIIDTLFKRNYLEGNPINVTKFGMTVYKALSKNCSMIMSIDTTRQLEEDMDLISKGKKSEAEVIKEGKEILLKAIETFDNNKERIAKEMGASFIDANAIGKCPKCGKELVIRKSKIGKQFVACSGYPNCTNTYPLPQDAKILPTENVCDGCNTPMIRIIRKGKPPFDMDLDPACTKHTIIFPNAKKKKEKEVSKDSKKETGKKETVKRARTKKRIVGD
jgi:DNA topoisomerase-1